MATKITLTKFDSGFANVPSRYEIGDWDDGSSHLVDCAEYILPDGYMVRESKACGLQVYDIAGRHHEIIEHSSGRPQLVGARAEMPVLKRA